MAAIHRFARPRRAETNKQTAWLAYLPHSALRDPQKNQSNRRI